MNIFLLVHMDSDGSIVGPVAAFKSEQQAKQAKEKFLIALKEYAEKNKDSMDYEQNFEYPPLKYKVPMGFTDEKDEVEIQPVPLF